MTDGVGDPKASFGAKKPPLHLVPASALIEASLAMALGAKKYGAYNWRFSESVDASVYIGAALRHIRAWYDGENNDPESGASHLGHAIASLAVLLDAARAGRLNDDRPPAIDHGAAVRDAIRKLDAQAGRR